MRAASGSDSSRLTDVTDLFSLRGRVAVVTGASSGLGRRFARVLHCAGATVVVTGRRVERLDELRAALGERIVVLPGDLRDREFRVQLVAAAVDVGQGKLDVLVNNAGFGDPCRAEDESLESFDDVLALNLTAVFHLCQLAARPMLRAGSGRIVNIASMLGLVASHPIPQAGYTASKGAVVNLTRELGAQWARRGVLVNALAPGWFPSELTQEMVKDEKSMAFVARNCPAGRFGEEHELDGALLFLASDACTYVVGQTLVVDGGWTAR